MFRSLSHFTRPLGAKGLCALVALPAAFALLAAAVLIGRGPTRLDLIADPGLIHGMEPLVALSFGVTGLGGTHLGLTITVVAMLVLVVSRLWHAALALAVAVGSTQAVVDLLKGLISRPRPEANSTLAEASGFSFPSGHSATSAALFGTLALIAIRHAPERFRTPLAASAVGLVALIGATRVMLGAHYPTDVLAGWALGATVALTSVALATGLRRLHEYRGA